MLLTELVALALGRRRLHRVRGSSMSPAYVEGDLVLVNPHAYRERPPRPGDVVLAQHPYKGVTLLKRVATVSADGRVRVVGDDPAQSTDSRQFGGIAPGCIEGRVVARMRG